MPSDIHTQTGESLLLYLCVGAYNCLPPPTHTHAPTHTQVKPYYFDFQCNIKQRMEGQNALQIVEHVSSSRNNNSKIHKVDAATHAHDGAEWRIHRVGWSESGT